MVGYMFELDILASSVAGLRIHSGKDNMLFTAFFVGTMTLACVIMSTCLFEVMRRKSMPPGPWAWPIVGSMFNLGALPYKTMRMFALKYGELMYLRLGSIHCVLISSAAMAKEVVTNHDLQFADRPIKLFSQLLFNGNDIVLASYGPAWRHLRMICNSQFFTKKRLAQSSAVREQEIHTLMKFLLNKSLNEENYVVNLPFHIRNTTTNIISQMVFNKRLFVDGGERNLEDAMKYQEILRLHFETHATFVIGDYIPCLRFITSLQGIRRKFKSIVDKIHKKMDDIIDLKGHERRLMQATQGQEPYLQKDFIDLLLETPTHDGKRKLDHETIRAVVMDMLFAGTETQSSTIEWAMAYLIRNPDVMKQAQEELDNVVGTELLVQESDLERLPYLDAVLKEVMRVQPVAPLGLNHQSSEPCLVAGYKLPAQTRLIFNIHAIHRDPTVYDRPEEFDPCRFLTAGGGNVASAQQPFRLMPYSAGRRICPGMPLAAINVPHILAHLVHSFDWRLPGDRDPRELGMEEKFDGATSSRLHPLLIIAQPRKPAFLYHPDAAHSN